MNTFKSKYPYPGWYIVIWIMLVLFFDVATLYTFLTKSNLFIEDPATFCVINLIVFLFSALILFWLINFEPVMISCADTHLEFGFFLKNKVQVKFDEVKVLYKSEYRDEWSVILIVRKRYVAISSKTFPGEIKKVLKKTGVWK